MAPPRLGNDDDFVDDTFDPNNIQFDGLDDLDDQRNQNIPPELFADAEEPEYDQDGQPLLPAREDDEEQNDGQAPRRNARGPRPAFMGAGNMRSNDLDSLVQNFWQNNQNEQPGQRQQSPQEKFFSGLLDKLDNIGNGAGSQDEREGAGRTDREWENFLKDRNLAPSMEDVVKAFNEAGNDPVKNQQAIHGMLRATAVNTYRQVAQDMQPLLTQLMQQMIPAYLKQHQSQISSEQQFNASLQRFYDRNPHMQRQQLAPVIRQVMQQALVKSSGNVTAAIRLAEAFTQKHMTGSAAPSGGRNGFRNTAASNSINWSQVAARGRG
jgi:hypothetical protein